MTWKRTPPKRVRKLKKKLPPTQAQIERRREVNRQAKKRAYNAQRDTIQERFKNENASCADLDWILRFVAYDDERPGCWVWRGPWATWFQSVKPTVRRGAYGKMPADKAVWKALERPGLVNRNYLKTTCGWDDCVSPEHIYATNATMERARKIMAAGCEST